MFKRHLIFFVLMLAVLSGCYLSKPVPDEEKSRDESAFADYSEAVFHNEDGQYKTALKKIEEAIGKNNKIAKFYVLKAQILENSGRQNDALSVYKQALKVQIYNPGVYEKMGKLLADMEQYHSAIQNVKKAYAQKPQETRYLTIIADYYIQLNMYDRAASYLTTYESQTSSENYICGYYLAKAKIYYHEGNYPETVNALDKCRTSKPLTTELHKLYLDALLNSGKYDAFYQHLVKLDPEIIKRGDEHFYRGAYYYHKKNYEDALAQLEFAVQFDTQDSRVYYYLGKVHFELGNLSKSKEMFDIFRSKTDRPELDEINLGDMNQSGM